MSSPYDLCQLTFGLVDFHMCSYLFYKPIVPTKSTPHARLAFVWTEEGVYDLFLVI